MDVVYLGALGLLVWASVVLISAFEKLRKRR